MIYALSATKRTSSGKRAKDEHKNMRVPAVMYGQGIDPQMISVPKTEFSRMFAAAGSSTLVDLSIENATPVKVVIKDVQVHPITMAAYHIDFHQVRMDKELTAQIPLKFINDSAAVKVMGGTLIKSIDALTVTCLPGDLPHEIEVDLAKLAKFEDTITLATLVLPKGVKVQGDTEMTIATVAPPLTEDQIKEMEASTVGDVTAVKSEVEEKRAAKEAAEPEKKDDKKDKK